MLIQGALILWFILTALTIVYYLWDITTNTPMLGVMKLGWFLVLLYTGPIGLFLYLTSCRQPLPQTHAQFIQPHWKQALGSMIHCIAGDATGIIVTAAIVFHFGLANGIDLILEYTSAFIVGWMLFQAVFMLGMYQGHYGTALKKTFFAETVSMNMVMVGMFPVMVLLMHYLPEADNPTRPEFWGVMSLATLAGMLTAYPINSWMVRRGIKHGMMSPTTTPMRDMKPSASHQEGSPLSMAQSLVIVLGTLALLFGALWLTHFWAPIHFYGINH